MNAAGCLAQTLVLQRSQMNKLAQVSQLWPGYHNGNPVPAHSHLLHFLLFLERRCFTLHAAVLGIQIACLNCQLWGSCHCLYIYCHLHWKPLELFSGKKANFCSVNPLLNFSSSLLLCVVTLQCRMSLKSQRVCTIPAKAIFSTPSRILAPAGTRSSPPCCMEKSECIWVNIREGIF